MVRRIQDVLPQPGQGPAAEPEVGRRPPPEFFAQPAPGRTNSFDPENTIQNKTMIHWLPAIWVSNGPNKALDEGPFIVGY
jgi:hypothetical protein